VRDDVGLAVPLLSRMHACATFVHCCNDW
jgi:hypothetical protein